MASARPSVEPNGGGGKRETKSEERAPDLWWREMRLRRDRLAVLRSSPTINHAFTLASEDAGAARRNVTTRSGKRSNCRVRIVRIDACDLRGARVPTDSVTVRSQCHRRRAGCLTLPPDNGARETRVPASHACITRRPET